MQFNKPWRYTIGEKLQTSILCVIELTTQSLYSRQPLKEPLILKALGTIQIIQLFIRLAYEEKLITERHFFAWSEQTTELSRMAGGWLSSVRSPSSPKTSPGI